MQNSGSWLLCALASLLLSTSAAHGAAHPSFDVRPEQEVLARLLRARASQFELGTIAANDGRERFRISTANGHIKVDGSTPSALLFGVNWPKSLPAPHGQHGCPTGALTYRRDARYGTISEVGVAAT
jgi:alpha-N-acetylglucosaminidase